MESSSAKTHSYRFGPFRLEPRERRLLRDDKPVALTPKAFDLLLILVENSGRLLDKDALMKHLWADAFVEEANLANNISLLRRALGDPTDGAEYIETVPRRGYRFLADVARLDQLGLNRPGAGTSEAISQPDIASAATLSATVPLAPTTPRWFAVTLAVLLGVAVVTSVALALRRFENFGEDSRLVRFNVDPPSGTSFPLAPDPLSPTISRDGTRLLFRVLRAGEPVLAIRSIDKLNAEVLPGTEHATFPFWSPDGRVVAFFAGGKLKKISASGGPVQTICDAAPGFGGTWNRDGVIVFAPSATEGLFKVAAAGGNPTPVTRLKQNEVFHQHPQFLPDGRRFLYFAAPDGIYLGSLDGGTPVRVLTSARMALYAPPGEVLFVENRTLFAQRFDAQRLGLSGDPLPLVDDIRIGGRSVRGRPVGGAAISASENGVLVYGTAPTVHPKLVWLDRVGKVLGSVGPLPFETFADSELSPDGNQIAITNGTQPYGEDVWLFNLRSGQSTQLTFNSAADRRPVWSPDGRRVAFMSARPEGPGIYRKVVSGEKPEELLVRSDVSRPAWPSDWASSGIVYAIQGDGVWMLTHGGDRKPSALVHEQVSQPDAKFTADGRWLAYTSDESGRPEVFVRNTSTGGKWRISATGGSFPRWRRDGKELFYLAGDGQLMTVRIEDDAASLRPGNPEALFQTALNSMPARLRAFSVAPNGQRFLVAVSDAEEAKQSLVVVSNWQAALPR